MTIHPESIPHLLHNDLAYLWVLEKQPELRPRTWEARLEAWQYLVELLLIGELDVKEEVIREPLIAYTSQHGIDKVSWALVRGSDEFVGVLSPVVLVRPLPDFTDQDLAKLKQVYEVKRRREDIGFYLHLAIRELKTGQPPGSFRTRLASILEKEFALGQTNRPNNAFGARIHVAMLRQLLWTQRVGQPATIDQVDVLIRRSGNGDRVYVPRCKTCSYTLTKSRASAPISVDESGFRVECENPSGGHINQLDVTDFLIWIRPDNKVIVWDQDGATAIPEKGFPPKSYIKGIHVEFEWNEAQIDGEREKRFLVLEFKQKELIQRKLKDIFFDTILVPGHFEEFRGLPFRPEWADALENPDQVQVNADPVASRVTYGNLRIKGWPMPLTWTYSGSWGVVHKSNLGVGIYPDPNMMPEQWRWYRCFLHGSLRREHRIQTASSQTILPWLVESVKGSPQSLSVTDKTGDVGATYFIKNAPSAFADDNRSNFYLGIDFGTTNTIVYFLPPGEDAENPLPETNGLKPSLFGTNVKWLAKCDGFTDVIGDFLPGLKYGEKAVDPYIIPSALWKKQDQVVIRWGPDEFESNPQTPGTFKWDKALGNFKWDKEGVPNYAYRKAYLRELLLLSLPLVISNLGLHSSKAKFHIGFAFPLAFNYKARRNMQTLLDEVDETLRTTTGFDYESYSINESTACVRAFGAFNRGDTFLVADMGGGTMDISFFTVGGSQPNTIHQIGSVQFAGETYVRALARKKQSTAEKEEDLRWSLRDAISSSASRTEYGKDEAARTILDRFGALAFEFLRTLIAAYREFSSEEDIHLVLVGNGWHLAEAFSSEVETRGDKRVFNEHYSHLMAQLAQVNLKLYFGEPVRSLRSSKHLIVIGALKNVKGQKSKELAEEPSLSKLPAGRDFEFVTTKGRVKRISWHDLVGEAVGLTDFSIKELTKERSDFFLTEVPDFHEPWESYLLRIFEVADQSKIPYPDIPILRDNIHRSIDGHPPKITKGPLQIILEQRWTDWLIED